MSEPEPDPVPNQAQPVWDLVIADMHERNRVGTAKYGTPLQAHNGRDVLVDRYQELLDACVYTRQEIEERFKQRAAISRAMAALETDASRDERRAAWIDLRHAFFPGPGPDGEQR